MLNQIRYLLIIFFSFNFLAAQTTTVKFEVKVPSDSSQKAFSVFLTGSFNGWNTNDPLYVMKEVGDNLYSIVVPVFAGKKYEYKYTKGNWSSVELSVDGKVIKNRQMFSKDGITIQDTVFRWKSATFLYLRTGPFPYEEDYKNIVFISWETQSWKLDGSSIKIKLYSNGYSELTAKLHNKIKDSIKTKMKKNGWNVFEYEHGAIKFIKRNVIDIYKGQQIFHKLLSDNITQLEPLQATYSDGAGTAVGIKTYLTYREIVIAVLSYNKNSAQYKIFAKCRKILSIEKLNEMFWSAFRD